MAFSQNTILILVTIVLILGAFYWKYNNMESFELQNNRIEPQWFFSYAHVYALRNSGNIDEARIKVNDIFAKLRMPKQEYQKADQHYRQYEKFFQGVSDRKTHNK